MNKITCMMCGAQFDTEEELNDHNAEEHADAMIKKEKHDGPMICSMCNNKFSTSEELDKHIKEAHKKM